MCTHTEKSLGMRLRIQYVTATWVTVNLSHNSITDFIVTGHLLMTVTLVGGEEEEVTGPSGAGVSTIP